MTTGRLHNLMEESAMTATNEMRMENEWFQEHYDRHKQRLKWFLRRRGLKGSDVEDVAQEVWIKVWRNCQQFDDNNFVAWLFCIARNCATDQYRKSRIRDKVMHRFPSIEKTDPCRSDLSSDLNSLLEKTDNIFLQVLQAQIEGEPVRITANRLGISINTVYSRRNRGRNLANRVLQGAPN